MLKNKGKYAVAIVGAARAVGREMVSLLEERSFPASDLVLFGSERSEGVRVEFRGKNLPVKKLAKDSFAGIDIVLFADGTERSRKHAPAAVAAEAVVIDSSGAFRSDPKVPLVVPEVNAGVIEKHEGIIASPSCSAIGLLLALKPLHDAAKVRRVVVTTFQSVSGTGKEAMDELAGQTVALLNFKDVEKKVYPHQIAFNCLPHIGVFSTDGSTSEETEIADGTRRVLADDSVRVSVTCVRVPVFRGTALSVSVEMQKKLSINDARAAIAGIPGVVVYDDPTRDLYPLQLDAAGEDEVYVGRVREDRSVESGLNLWIVTDDLRKGSALNAVQIAEHLVR